MEAMNISGEFSKLESIYIHKLLDIVSALPTKNGYIIWQVKLWPSESVLNFKNCILYEQFTYLKIHNYNFYKEVFANKKKTIYNMNILMKIVFLGGFW